MVYYVACPCQGDQKSSVFGSFHLKKTSHSIEQISWTDFTVNDLVTYQSQGVLCRLLTLQYTINCKVNRVVLRFYLSYWLVNTLEGYCPCDETVGWGLIFCLLCVCLSYVFRFVKSILRYINNKFHYNFLQTQIGGKM